jgi:hypothetical protein
VAGDRQFSGPALAAIAAGALFVTAGIKGWSIPQTIQDVIQGKNPLKDTANTANQISVSSISQIESEGADAAAGTSSGASGTPGAYSSEGVTNCITVAKYLMANGYNRAGAAGIAGCIYGESSGNPEATGAGSYGLIQWQGSQYASLVTGNPAADFATQLPAIITYNNAQGADRVAIMKTSFTEPIAAADYYSQQFERPAVTDSDVNAGVATLVFVALI